MNKLKELNNVKVLNQISLGKSAELEVFDETNNSWKRINTEPIINYSLKDDVLKMESKNDAYKIYDVMFENGLPMNKYEYTEQKENAGYIIESRLCADDGLNYVLAYNPNTKYNCDTYVTWVENVLDAGEPRYNVGHYFNDRESALKDLLVRFNENKNINLRLHYRKEIFYEDLEAVLLNQISERDVEKLMKDDSFKEIMFDKWMKVDEIENNFDILSNLIQEEIIKRNFLKIKLKEESIDLDIAKFNELQLNAIYDGILSGIDVSIYAKPEFDVDQMEQIQEGLEDGLDVSVYAKPEFDDLQMREIYRGLQEGLDVSWYAKPEFYTAQMEQIREGLEHGVGVRVYAKPEFEPDQMQVILLGLEKGLDVNIYAKPELDSFQMEQICEGLEQGLDVSWYAKQEFNASQMFTIREGLQEGLDVSEYAYPNIDVDQMEDILLELKQQEEMSL